jgi:spoIIIJ-associated protein
MATRRTKKEDETTPAADSAEAKKTSSRSRRAPSKKAAEQVAPSDAPVIEAIADKKADEAPSAEDTKQKAAADKKAANDKKAADGRKKAAERRKAAQEAAEATPAAEVVVAAEVPAPVEAAPAVEVAPVVEAAPTEEPAAKERPRRTRRRNQDAEQVEQIAPAAEPVAEPPAAAPLVEAAPKAARSERPKRDKQEATERQEGTERQEASRPASLTPQELLASGQAWLDGLIQHMKLDATASAAYDEPTRTLVFDLDGPGATHLLGPHGSSPRAVEALQSVMREVINADRSGLKLHVDVGGFRLRRAERLGELADRMAACVERVGTSITVAGMNDFERRVIHQALEPNSRVRTESHGQGTFRKLRLEPNA